MENVYLPTSLNSGRSWTQTLPPGSRSSDTGAFGYDSGQQTMTVMFRGTWENLRAFVKQVIGYSQVIPTFDPSNTGNQRPTDGYILRRVTPARHPRLRGMRATKIMNWYGLTINKTGSAAAGGGSAGEGHVGGWEYIIATVAFEMPRYPILNDEELTVGGVRQSECRRYLEWSFDSNLETLARPGEVWNFCASGLLANFTQRTFPGERALRIPKGVLKWTWYNIAEDFVVLGKLCPASYMNRLGTLNASPFPPDPYRDQNKALGDTLPYAEFPAGTLLLLPPKVTHSPQCHPTFLSGIFVGNMVPRMVNVEGSAAYFNPPSDDTTTIDLSAANYGGDAMTQIKGWNLVPLLNPRVGAVTPAGLFYACHRGAAGAAPASDAELLYQYSDWSALFKGTESFT